MKLKLLKQKFFLLLILSALVLAGTGCTEINMFKRQRIFRLYTASYGVYARVIELRYEDASAKGEAPNTIFIFPQTVKDLDSKKAAQPLLQKELRKRLKNLPAKISFFTKQEENPKLKKDQISLLFEEADFKSDEAVTIKFELGDDKGSVEKWDYFLERKRGAWRVLGKPKKL